MHGIILIHEFWKIIYISICVKKMDLRAGTFWQNKALNVVIVDVRTSIDGLLSIKTFEYSEDESCKNKDYIGICVCFWWWGLWLHN